MTGKKLQRLLACLLAVLLLSQVCAFLPAARAAGGYTLQNGSAIIKPGMSDGEVNRALTRALVVGFDQMSAADQNVLLDSLQWEYYCEGKDTKTGLIKHSDWGKIGGFESETSVGKSWYKVTTYYKHPALAENSDGNYNVRVQGTQAAVTLTKAEKLDSSISLRSSVQVKMPYTDAGALDFNALRARIFEQVVASSTPNLTVNDVHIEYYAKSELVSHKEWVKLEGEFVTVPLFDKKVGYPAISEGNWKIKITFDGNADYKGCSREMDVTFLDRDAAPFHLKGGVTEVGIVYNADQSINYAATGRYSAPSGAPDKGCESAMISHPAWIYRVPRLCRRWSPGWRRREGQRRPDAGDSSASTPGRHALPGLHDAPQFPHRSAAAGCCGSEYQSRSCRHLQ